MNVRSDHLGRPRLTVAVRLAFCLGWMELGVIGTGANFIGLRSENCGGGVEGPNDTLHDEAALLVLPKDSLTWLGKPSDIDDR